MVDVLRLDDLGSSTIDGLPHYDILTEHTLPESIFLLNDVQTNESLTPHIAQTQVRNRSQIATEDDSLEQKSIMYDFDNMSSENLERDITPDEFNGLLVELQDKYLHPFQNMNEVELKDYVYELWELDILEPGMVQMRDINMGYKRNLCQVLKILMLFSRYNMVGKDSAETIYNQQIFNRVLKAIFYMNEKLTAEYYIQKSTDEYIMDEEDDINLFRFTPQDYSKNNAFQNLVIYLLNRAFVKGYRLYRESCFKQIYHNNYPTHAWTYVCPVQAFVYDSINRETNGEMWRNLTQSKDNPERAAKYLISARDREFPMLEPDRHLFAFTDGIYDAKNVMFHPYEKDPLPSDRVAIKFFDMPFNVEALFMYEDWYDIPTPDFQTILDFQKLDEEVCRVLYMMMGRCLYEVGEMDTWEVIMFIKGVAGSGKSTIGKILKYFYPSSDVAILSSNIEKKFGLQSIYDKLMFLCLEVKANWGLDQADFQSMISGEEISIAVKHKNARSVIWKVPGMLMGNEVARGWRDAANSLTRRIVILDFKYQVKNTDTTLAWKLKQAVPSLLHKCNMAYRTAVKEIGSQNIWNCLPEYFKITQQKLAADINPLVDFLNSPSDFELDPEGYVPFTDFRTALFAYMDKSGDRNKPKFNEDYYRTTFENYGLSVQSDTRLYGGVMKKDRWINGIRLKDPDGYVVS